MYVIKNATDIFVCAFDDIDSIWNTKTNKEWLAMWITEGCGLWGNEWLIQRLIHMLLLIKRCYPLTNDTNKKPTRQEKFKAYFIL